MFCLHFSTPNLFQLGEIRRSTKTMRGGKRARVRCRRLLHRSNKPQHQRDQVVQGDRQRPRDGGAVCKWAQVTTSALLRRVLRES